MNGAELISQLITELQKRNLDKIEIIFHLNKSADNININIEKPKKNELDCPFDFTSRCSMGSCDCKPKKTVL